MKTKLIYIVFLLFLTFYSCKKDAVPEPTDYPFVILSEVNNITSDGATFNANITNLGNQKILDFGFAWNDSTSKPTINSIIKSLGNNPSLGEFSYRVNSDLEKGKIFHVRAYVKTDKVIVYSNINSFISEGCLPPVITKFYPESGSSGRVVTIIGENFSSKLSNNKIYFGTIQGNIIKVNFDTILVQCPNTLQTLSVNIKVNVAKQESESQKKFKLIYPWTQLQNFPGGARYFSSYFTIGTKGYVCLGMEGWDTFSSKTLWEYDTIAKNWNQKKEFPGNKRIDAISFSLLNKGYIGLGYNYDNGITNFKDLYEFDPTLDIWSKKADFPGNIGYFKPTNFVIDHKLYLYTGRVGNELWMYDPLTDLWELLPKLIIIDNKFFSGSCSLNSLGYLFEYSDDNFTPLWKFDPIQNVVVKISNLPKSPKSWYEGDCFTLNNLLYIPFAQGKIIQYDISDKNFYIITEPSIDFSLNFMFTFEDKVIINKFKSNLLYEFCPK